MSIVRTVRWITNRQQSLQLASEVLPQEARPGRKLGSCFADFSKLPLALRLGVGQARVSCLKTSNCSCARMLIRAIGLLDKA